MADTNPFASVGLSQFRAEGGADGLGSNLLSMGTACLLYTSPSPRD